MTALVFALVMALLSIAVSVLAAVVALRDNRRILDVLLYAWIVLLLLALVFGVVGLVTA